MKEIKIPESTDKAAAFQTIEKYLDDQDIRISSQDQNRPWGGFFCIDERDTHKFIAHFFTGIPGKAIHVSEKLSPKILLVEKGKRLSWQYHHRRAEIWRVVGGPVLVMTNDGDEENEPEEKRFNETVVLRQGQRHRLIGGKGWGIIAEIWQHTDREPSNEEDIVRLQDDYGR